MNIKKYLDSTCLKTAEQAGLDYDENLKLVKGFVQEAIDEHFKLIMIRPDMVAIARKMVVDAGSNLQIGTVIGFPGGNSTIADKLFEAEKAIQDGADDLDFVCNYEAFKNGDVDLVKGEVLKGTQLGIENNKVVKWIIEVAALNDMQIVQLTALIKNVVISNFKEDNFSFVFVKSSTGFYTTENNLPNGATIHAIKLMLENATPLSVKAAGGVRTYDEAVEMIKLGVKRIGTSGAKAIANAENTNNGY
ncbi:deoxyribose-phosphate aldolase [Flavobacterium hiemivividum]|uniref:Deoxyribose-phosphate aldolase n=1 Tax=Flavobacterium hiemivividum TaxID=2541734 RepID=A0A4R5CZR2_9FLAO|nr:deoxyribose-phosphate aldolase [Flavobacterium hiemivividum]TDE06392.1 deoxyribose-phosphate aldolase [Flavobacterium hiemivividum]